MYRKSMREALQEARAYRDPLQEDKGFSSQQIKMAYGVLNDPRYKQGNYSGAVKAIEKIAKGLSNHPDVANALKRANEELDKDDKETIKPIIKQLQKSVKAHDRQAKQLQKDIQDEVELDEALEVKWDSNKQGWFDKQGRRRYLGNMATNKLMSKAIDKAKETGDFINPFKLKHGQKPEETDLKEARWRIEGSLGYKRISPRDDFDMVIDAPTESAAENKAYDELDKARDKRKIGPGGGGSVEDVEIETVERTNDRLSAPETFRGLT